MIEAVPDHPSALHPSPEFEEFRELLLSSEKRDIDSIDERLEDIRNPDSIGDRLPDAMFYSVQNNREKMAASLSPILGPAIRLYVNEMFKSLVDQMNVSIQNATSVQSYRWRREAKAAGISYSEFVLLKSLNFSMDDAMLIDAESGLLQQHAWKGENSSIKEDADLVSGMLAAIRSFAKDTLPSNPDFSPGYNEAPELERFSFGDYEIFVHTGPESILAVIGTGVPPKEYRDLLLEVSENIHLYSRPDFTDSDLDQPNKAIQEMERLLIEQRPTVQETKTWPAWIIAGTAVLGLAGWGAFAAKREATWERGMAAISATPGIELLDAKKTNGWGGQRTIRVLKDPMAPPPASVLKDEIGALAEKANIHISPYMSMASDFVDTRNKVAASEQVSLTNKVAAEAKGKRDELSSNLHSIINSEKQTLTSKLNALQAVIDGPLGVVPSKLTPVLFENRFGNSGAGITRTEKGWEVTGTVLDSDFNEIQNVTASLIFDGANLNFSNLKTRPQRPEFEIRSEAIEQVQIKFPSGESTITDSVKIAFETVIGKMKSLDQWCLDSGKPLPFYEIHAAPILGSNDQENLRVKEQRLSQLFEVIAAERITTSRIRFIHAPQTFTQRSGLFVRPLERSADLPVTIPDLK